MSIEDAFKITQLTGELDLARMLNTALANAVREAIEDFENGDYDEALANLKIVVGVE